MRSYWQIDVVIEHDEDAGSADIGDALIAMLAGRGLSKSIVRGGATIVRVTGSGRMGDTV